MVHEKCAKSLTGQVCVTQIIQLDNPSAKELSSEAKFHRQQLRNYGIPANPFSLPAGASFVTHETQPEPITIDSDNYLLKDGEVETTEKLTMFLDWCKKEGVIMPKLEYPASFEENGLVGIRCKQDIQNREAYIYVPYKVMFTVDRIEDHQVLGPIIENRSGCFSDERRDDSEMLILTLGLFYEIGLGTQSYWYPWLRWLLDGPQRAKWTEEELATLQDDYCAKLLMEDESLLEPTWKQFAQVLKANLSVFPEKLIEKELFEHVYFLVCTRCFGYGQDATAMVPMAGNLNHSDRADIKTEMINLSLHL